MEQFSRALAELKVVDLGQGMAAAIAVKLIAELGAHVTRFEPASGDPFYALYPAYPVWHGGARMERAASSNDAAIERALATADACIVGGEDFPGLDWRPDANSLAARHPQLAILVIEGYPVDGAAADRPAVELLVQARSGLTFEQFSDRPIQISYSPGSYGAALHGLIGLMGVLCQREHDGRGGVVRTSLFEGAMTVAAQLWMAAEKPSGTFGFVMPKDPHPLVFRCRDGRAIHFVLGSFGSKGRLYRILEVDDPSVGPDDSGIPTGRGDPRNFFGDIDVLREHVAKVDSDWLMARMEAAGIAANFVLAPGDCWDDSQVAHIGTIAADTMGGRHVGLPIRGSLNPDPAAPMKGPPTSGDSPLANMRVLDFGMFVAGPYGTVPLADLGADVIKVETLQGDPNRAIYRTFGAVNRGKRSIAVDLKSPDGRAIAERLAASAQVLHNNFRPGVSGRLGLDPASQHAIDPDRIILESTGYGRTGPNGERPGFDMIFQAFCGHEVRAGGIGNDPMWDRTAMVDYFTGLLNAFATTVAAWRRARGGGGADIELSLLDASLLLLSELVERPDCGRVGADPLNATQTGYRPSEALYQCRDGWIAIAARGAAMLSALSNATGVPLDPSSPDDSEDGERLAQAFASLSVEEAQSKLDAAAVWCERVNAAGAYILIDDGDAPGIILTTEHPVYGAMRQVGGLVRLGGKRASAPRSVPLLGEHSREILGEIGYAAAEIDDFFARGIVA